MGKQIMVNKLWSFFIIIGVIFGIITDNTDKINASILNSGKTALTLIINLFPVMALWLGIINIAEKSGLVEKISIFFSPLLIKLFPDIPKGHPALGYISTNVIANLFGLGNAATPFGLKSMKSLQEINKNKEVASKSMITFLVLNTSGITIIPTTIISLRMMYGSQEPTKIILGCLIVSLLATCSGLIINHLVGKQYHE